MAGGGRISLLVDSPLPALIQALKGVDAEANKQIQTYTKADALPIWQGVMGDRLGEVIQYGGRLNRAYSKLAASGQVGVTKQNLFLRAGRGKLASGTPLARINKALEYGLPPDKPYKRKTKSGRAYTIRSGNRFLNRPPRPVKGWLVSASASKAIPRIAALWVQTYLRTMHEQVEGANRG